MKTLAISHNIFLSTKERKLLIKGKSITTWGISCPVWFERKQLTPFANEIFCQYYISNSPSDFPIIQLSDGWKVNLPQITETHPRLTPKETEDLTKAEIEL